MSGAPRVRQALQSDVAPIAALATQVFLDTYATQGVRTDLAREALDEYSEQAFLNRFAESERMFLVAERGDGLLGFAEILGRSLGSPVDGVSGAELVRLYVQPRAQRAGTGRLLISEGESVVSALSLSCLWLTVWEGNANALAFYSRMGYAEVGATAYCFQGNTYGNRVLAKRFGAA